MYLLKTKTNNNKVTYVCELNENEFFKLRLTRDFSRVDLVDFIINEIKQLRLSYSVSKMEVQKDLLPRIDELERIAKLFGFIGEIK